MYNLAIFSLGQWAQANIEILKDNLFELANIGPQKVTRLDVWKWFTESQTPSYLSQLRLEQLEEDQPSIVLENVRVAFNAKFHVNITSNAFTESFVAMSTMTPEACEANVEKIKWLLASDYRVLLLSHTNHPHLRLFLDQMKAYNPELSEQFTIFNSKTFNPDCKIWIATSMHMQTIEHPQTLREVLVQLESPPRLVSFLNTATKSSDYPYLQYLNPGKGFQYFKSLIHAVPPQTPVRHCCAVSLGELFDEQELHSFLAFKEIIQKKYVQEAPLDEVLSQILGRAKQPDGHITQFKMGALVTPDFINLMLNDIQDKTVVTLTSDEFKTAWHAKNSVYTTKLDKLIALVSAQSTFRERGYELKLVSYTNPLDMSNLVDECIKRDLPVTCVDGEVIKIGDIDLLTSYRHRMNTIELVDSLVVKKARSIHLWQPTPVSHVTYLCSQAMSENNKELIAMSALPGVQVADQWDKNSSLIEVLDKVIHVAEQASTRNASFNN